MYAIKCNMYTQSCQCCGGILKVFLKKLHHLLSFVWTMKIVVGDTHRRTGCAFVFFVLLLAIIIVPAITTMSIALEEV